jgi:Spy/CpxP family protein refolding chaperone
MKRAILVALVLLATAVAPSATSPYAGQQNRPIKSLDAATVQELQNGEGHGMALVGELNHYPGPRHVLAMASHLDLTDAQKAETQAIFDQMHAVAVPLWSANHRKGTSTRSSVRKRVDLKRLPPGCHRADRVFERTASVHPSARSLSDEADTDARADSDVRFDAGLR